ncbi:MAG: hypothetical protein LQ346_002135 [Caloplaca aetnensis]|nr:MAG: hypothetical protein LQ346_002135 [Caloplaca aetnensis]
MADIPSSPGWSTSSIAEIESMVRTLELPKGGVSYPDISKLAADDAPASRTRSRKANLSAKAASSKPIKQVDVDLTAHSSQDSTPPKSRPRKRRLLSKAQVEKEKLDGGAAEVSTPKKRKTVTPKTNNKSEEKRLRTFRKQAPQSYRVKLDRAISQRMFVVNRTRGGTETTPSETVEMAGTTGNIYSITIGLEPRCTCPDNKKGNQCKHIVYVLHNVLKAPEHLQYQLAFLSSELREIFAHAPAPVEAADKGNEEVAGKRKEVAGDCPICFMEFEPETEDIVWCKAACGNNIHKDCFEQWAKSQGAAKVKCVYCRTPWQGDADSIARIKTEGKMNSEGYVNVASQLGLSRRRDTSTYHQFWLHRQERMGYDVGGYDDDDENYDYDH